MRWVLIAATLFAVLLHVALMGFQEQCARQEIQRLRQQVRLAEQLCAVQRANYQAAIFGAIQRGVEQPLLEDTSEMASLALSQGDAAPQNAARGVVFADGQLHNASAKIASW